MKIKKATSLFLALLFLISVFSLTAFAAEGKADIAAFELPKPAAPVYLMFDAADRGKRAGKPYLQSIHTRTGLDGRYLLRNDRRR